jgi:predicted ATPase/DNA-binding XRE family transcriptional regulator
VRAGFSQEALAERAGVSVATIGALEEGRRRRPHPGTLAALAAALGIPPSDLMARLELSRTSVGGTPDSTPVPPAPATTHLEPATHQPEVGRGVPVVRLPTPPTALVGRERDQTAAAAKLDPTSSHGRLLTLLGPGGVGKTRLALAVAGRLAPMYSDGVTFVDLAPLRDARLVSATIAVALDVRESDGRSARDLLREHLRERQLLLILDNFEHVLGAAPLLAELLEACPRLRLLVTSRTALRLRSEQRYSVLPLAAPTKDLAGLDAIAASPAVRLFVDRARAVGADFALDARNAHAVAAICRHVDGLPLAIELAAARAALLPPEALLPRVERRLPLLTGGAADLPPRQRTLRETLNWSQALLGPAEQVLFRRLAVFAGGWTLAAAEAVCADADLTADDVLEHLGALVDSSLVQSSIGVQGEPRFGMLETIREYASEQQAQAGETVAIARRHLEWCLALVRPGSADPPDPQAIGRLAQEHDNLRAALRGAIDTGAVEDGLWLAVALTSLWFVRGAHGEGRDWLTTLLAMSDADPRVSTAARAHALAAAGLLAFCQAEYATAESLLGDAQALIDPPGTELLAGVIVHFLGNVARRRGQLARAQALCESALASFQRLGHRMWEATTLAHLAFVRHDQGNLTSATRLARASLALFEASGNTWGASRALRVLARVAADQGDRTSARSLHEAGMALDHELGDDHGRALSLVALADDVLSAGDRTTAHRRYAESLTLAQSAGDRLLLARSLEGLASLRSAERPESAVRLAAAADALRTSLGAADRTPQRERLRRWLAAAEHSLGAPAFSAAWAAGQALDITRVMAEALQTAPHAPGAG